MAAVQNATQKAFLPTSIGTIDIVVIIVYLIFCLLVGIWATWRAQKSSIRGYFLAGKDMLWFAVGASLFSSNIGSGILVGLAGSGAASGIAVASYELIGLYAVLLMAWMAVPIYIASGVYTLPEYLQKRFGGKRLQIYMSLLSLLLYIFTKLSTDMFAGTVFIQQAVGWNIYAGVALLLVISAIFTVTGGLKAVIYTDTLQTVVMVIGGTILMAISFHRIGGLEQIYTQYPTSIPSSIVNGSDCGKPREDAFHLLRDAVTSDLPWPGNILGISILAIWYCCYDQVMVQRCLAAKNMIHVKGGAILAGYLKILPLFFAIFPGMISRILFTDQVACVDPDVCRAVCDNSAGCSNIAYPKLVIELLPEGLKGLMLAAMMAAVMSSLTSVFNSSSTIFTIDIWRRVRPNSTDGELLIVGRIFTVILVVISILWMPILQSSQGGQLFNYFQAVTSYLAPPVMSVYILAMFWKRTTEAGAFYGLVVGFIVGCIRMGLDFGYGTPSCGEVDNRPSVISKVHFLYFAIILFVTSLVTTIVVSVLTKPVDEEHFIRLTWSTRHSDQQREPFEEEKEMVHRKKSNAGSDSPTDIPRWKKVLFVMCGYQTPDQVILTDAERREQLKQLTDIKEEPKWKIFVNFNAVILLMVVIFLWGFFA